MNEEIESESIPLSKPVMTCSILEDGRARWTHGETLPKGTALLALTEDYIFAVPAHLITSFVITSRVIKFRIPRGCFTTFDFANVPIQFNLVDREDENMYIFLNPTPNILRDGRVSVPLASLVMAGKITKGGESLNE